MIATCPATVQIDSGARRLTSRASRDADDVVISACAFDNDGTFDQDESVVDVKSRFDAASLARPTRTAAKRDHAYVVLKSSAGGFAAVHRARTIPR